MPDDRPYAASFAELLRQGQGFLHGLEALEAQLSVELADRLSELARLRDRVESLEAELGPLREAQRLSGMERDRLGGEIERGRKALDAATNRLEEQRQRLEAEVRAVEARQDEERAGLEDRLKAREASLELARTDVDELQAQLEALQAGQLEWAAERQRLRADHDRLRAAHEEHEREVTRLKSQLTAAAADLETYSGYQLQWAAEREEHLKAARDAQARFEELVAQAAKQNSDATARRQTLVNEIQQLNQELNRALEALARTQERERLREKAVEELRQGWQKEKTELEIEVRRSRERGATSLPPEQIHALSSQLNAITGFSELLAQESANSISPEERLEFLRLINQSASRLVHDLAPILAPSANGETVGAPADPAAAARPRKIPTVLVADPDAAGWKKMEPLLVRAGYELVVTGDAASAMERALQVQPIAILVDVAVPPRGALGLVQDLKREARTRDLPIVLTSADEHVDVGADLPQPILLKPIDRQQLLQVLVKHDLLADNRRARKMPGTVLVIDDDRQHIRLVKALFKPFATKLLTSETGEEGFDLARQHQPDLIILDLLLPKGDGFATVEALRQLPATARTPIIVYTARRLPKEDMARLEGRVEAVIFKGDFNRERLVELILKRGERRGRSGQRAQA